MSSIKVRRGQGRVEFLASLPIIREQRRAGKTAAMTYENLKSSGRLTISYKQFWKYWAKMPDVPVSPSPLASPSPAPAQAASSAQVLPEVGATAALPPAEEAVLPKKRERKRKRDAVVNADFIPTEFPID